MQQNNFSTCFQLGLIELPKTKAVRNALAKKDAGQTAVNTHTDTHTLWHTLAHTHMPGQTRLMSVNHFEHFSNNLWKFSTLPTDSSEVVSIFGTHFFGSLRCFVVPLFAALFHFILFYDFILSHFFCFVLGFLFRFFCKTRQRVCTKSALFYASFTLWNVCHGSRIWRLLMKLQSCKMQSYAVI